ncbi:hypothetical protein E3421_RS12600 [Enterococcus hirae]
MKSVKMIREQNQDEDSLMKIMSYSEIHLMILIRSSIVYLKNKEVILMQLILQISTHDFLELDELCESVKNATNEKITVTNYIELMIQDELKMKREIKKILNIVI